MRPSPRGCPVKLIKLSDGRHTAVDDDVYEWARKYSWKPMGLGKYVGRSVRPPGSTKKSGSVYLHRAICGNPAGLEVDHIDGDRLNNQRSNLRVCTHQQNHQNRHTPQSKCSPYKGVKRRSLVGGGYSWQARIKIDGKETFLGAYKTEIEAAQAYNRAAVEHFGEFARLNDV